MTDATPAQLCVAADLLAQAATTTEGGVTGPTNIVYAAWELLPDCPAREGLDAIPSWHTYHDNPDGWRWMVQAARLRLLVEAAGPNSAALGATTYAWWQEVQGG